MNTKLILSATALAGALVTGNLAYADHLQGSFPARVDSLRGEPDLIGTARLDEGRGEVTFNVVPQQRRDGLQLRSDASNVRIISVELGYSDHRVEGLYGRELHSAMASGQTVTIQRGRPPGLRFVRVRYAMPPNSYPATLQLIQIHDGDGYTSKADQLHDRNGWYEYDRRTYERPDHSRRFWRRR